jgi:hypothetical protein
MRAALSWSLEHRDRDYVTAPSHFDACCAGISVSPVGHWETVSAVIKAYTTNHKVVAERIAASLPPAPRCSF